MAIFGVLVGFDVELFTASENDTRGAVLLLLVLTPMASVAFVHAISFLFTDPGKAQTLTVAMYVVTHKSICDCYGNLLT